LWYCDASLHLKARQVYTDGVSVAASQVRFTKKEEITMNKAILAFVLVAGFSTAAMAAEFKGYVIDEKCSAKAGMRGNVDCATACIKDGSPAVLVTADGKVYKLDDQAKVVPLAGKQVTVTGMMKGDTIAVSSVKE
jgi:hypothetical protein